MSWELFEDGYGVACMATRKMGEIELMVAADGRRPGCWVIRVDFFGRRVATKHGPKNQCLSSAMMSAEVEAETMIRQLQKDVREVKNA